MQQNRIDNADTQTNIVDHQLPTPKVTKQTGVTATPTPCSAGESIYKNTPAFRAHEKTRSSLASVHWTVEKKMYSSMASDLEDVTRYGQLAVGERRGGALVVRTKVQVLCFLTRSVTRGAMRRASACTWLVQPHYHSLPPSRPSNSPPSPSSSFPFLSNRSVEFIGRHVRIPSINTSCFPFASSPPPLLLFLPSLSVSVALSCPFFSHLPAFQVTSSPTCCGRWY